MQEYQPRDDYRELLELTCIFLGETRAINFRLPGLMHNARWLSNAIYCLKMFLFKQQVKIIAKEIYQL